MKQYSTTFLAVRTVVRGVLMFAALAVVHSFIFYVEVGS